jgi:hypothetical protein
MFEITIKGATLSQIQDRLDAMQGVFGAAADRGRIEQPDPKPARKSRPSKGEPQPEAEAPEQEEQLSAEDTKLQAELNEPAEPMPETAKAVVDAGTGQPVGATSTDSDEPIQMTMDDVKNAAAKLAAKDTPTLAKILKDYGAAKLSEVPKEKLGDFAADVMEALG